MGLCKPSRCGCTITSGSLQVAAKAGGIGYNIETYEGVATEIPDTRPLLADRFDGMRVWTTDTKRLFAWDAAGAEWLLLIEPPQTLVAADFVITQGATITKTLTHGRYQRRHGWFEWNARVTVTSAGTGGSAIAVYYPTPILPAGVVAQGTFEMYDASTGAYHLGLSLGNNGTHFVPLITPGNATTNFGSTVALAAGDQLLWTVSGELA